MIQSGSKERRKMKEATRNQLMSDIELWLDSNEGIDEHDNAESIRSLMSTAKNNLDMWDTFWPSIRACGAKLEDAGFANFPAAKGKTSNLPDEVTTAIRNMIVGTSRARIAAWEADPSYRYSIRKSGKSGGGFYPTVQELNDAENDKYEKFLKSAYKAAQAGDQSALYHATVNGDTLTVTHNGGQL